MEQEKLSFVDRMIQTAILYQKECLIGGACFLAVGALTIGIFSKGSSYLDFKKTEEAFLKWEAAPGDLKLFDELSTALKKTGSLGQRYQGAIAQKLIEANQFEKALPYAARSIAFLEKEFPLYASFSETTVLIEKGAYQEALERSIRLKEQIEKEDGVLYAHNLLRIAILQRELQNGPGETSAWRDFEDFLGWSGGPAENELSVAMLQSYRDKEVGLIQYIAERKAILAH